MFGEEPQLPIDFILGQDNLEPSGEPWIVQHRENMEQIFNGARARLKAAAAQRARLHDGKVHHDSLQEGQLVYRRSHKVRGRNKIQDVWDPALYRIVQGSEDPVYSICPADGTGSVKRIHRCELRPVCGSSNDPGLPLHMRDDLNSNVESVLIISEPMEEVGLQERSVENSLSGNLSVASPSQGDRRLRRTQRTTAGCHRNPHNLPQSALINNQRALPVTRPSDNSQSGLFRPWV